MFVCVFAKKFPALASQSCCEVSRPRAVGEYEYRLLYDYITQGAIIRSRATWYEMGEKNNKYFLNLENSNKTKSSVRKILTSNGALTSDPKKQTSRLFLRF